MESYNNVSFEDLMKMASKKDADAQAELSRRYADGISVEKNIRTAVEWAERAYLRGRTDLAAKIGNMCFECGDSEEYISKAIKYYSAGAQANDIECLCKMSVFYHNGDWGLPKDDAKSFEFVERALTESTASERDFAYAQYLMGNAYSYGIGVKPCAAEAVSRYLEASENGFALADAKLSECYLNMGRIAEACFYAKQVCESTDDEVLARGRLLYENIIAMNFGSLCVKPENTEVLKNEKDREISLEIRNLHDTTENFSGFEKEADRLVHNAETLMKIGNYKRVFPAYERVTYEYPSDFRGWYNLARVFTNNFAAYSIFEEKLFGKADESDFYENMTYASRTVQKEFAGQLEKIEKMYTNGYIDISIAELKNTMYKFYSESASAEKIAEFIRKYEDKAVYLYKKRPCVVTALSLHFLENILNNDNIKKYNEKVIAHNNSINSKINQKIQDYITELAQSLRIDKPKEYASNAEALEMINTDEEYRSQVEKYREQLMKSQEYYTEITNVLVFDVYSRSEFGKDRAYKKYYPVSEAEFDDDYVDFIISLANKCGIQMYGYEEFYTAQRKRKNDSVNSLISRAGEAQKEYHAEFIQIKEKYTNFTPYSDDLFADIARALVNYEIAYSSYEKANSSNVFKQVFKGKELKENREDTTVMFESAQSEVHEIAKSILSSAQNEIAELNERIGNKYPEELQYIILYDQTALDDIIMSQVKLMKSQHEQVQ